MLQTWPQSFTFKFQWWIFVILGKLVYALFTHGFVLPRHKQLLVLYYTFGDTQSALNKRCDDHNQVLIVPYCPDSNDHKKHSCWTLKHFNSVVNRKLLPLWQNPEIQGTCTDTPHIPQEVCSDHATARQEIGTVDRISAHAERSACGVANSAAIFTDGFADSTHNVHLSGSVANSELLKANSLGGVPAYDLETAQGERVDTASACSGQRQVAQRESLGRIDGSQHETEGGIYSASHGMQMAAGFGFQSHPDVAIGQMHFPEALNQRLQMSRGSSEFKWLKHAQTLSDFLDGDGSVMSPSFQVFVLLLLKIWSKCLNVPLCFPCKVAFTILANFHKKFALTMLQPDRKLGLSIVFQHMQREVLVALQIVLHSSRMGSLVPLTMCIFLALLPTLSCWKQTVLVSQHMTWTLHRERELTQDLNPIHQLVLDKDRWRKGKVLAELTEASMKQKEESTLLRTACKWQLVLVSKAIQTLLLVKCIFLKP